MKGSQGLTNRKIVFLHTRQSNYVTSCWNCLVDFGKFEIISYVWGTSCEAPFSEEEVKASVRTINRDQQTAQQIVAQIKEFAPLAIVVTGWADNKYLRVCEVLKGKIPIVVGSDSQWTGSIRQWLAVYSAPLYLKRFFDAMWVPGDKQKEFAHRLGYTGPLCWEGLYTCNQNLFYPAVESANFSPENYDSFLFVGRLVEDKGYDILIEAYSRYRAAVEVPLNLKVCGVGPLKCDNQSFGVSHLGFVQPSRLSSIMKDARAFILPSRKEPWGVVIHEAVSAGLPVIATDVCGAASNLVRDYWNGLKISANSPEELCAAMIWFHKIDAEHYAKLKKNSASISRLYTPRNWVITLLESMRLLGWLK